VVPLKRAIEHVQSPARRRDSPTSSARGRPRSTPGLRAQQLEQLGFLHISLQQPHELGFSSTFKLHP
jgi:hypothetical protein